MSNLDKNSILNFIAEVKANIYNLTYNSGESYIGSKIPPTNPEVFNFARIEEITSSTLSLMIKLYGDNTQHVKDFTQKLKTYSTYPNEEQMILNCCLGKLTALESDIKFGLLNTFEKEISGIILSDFINLAKASIDEGQKDVAAVLACAALEDALKKLAKLNNLNVENKTMSAVVNALKSGRLMKSTQGNLIDAYVTLRNKTFHAEWDKIESPDVKSLISFTEEFLVKHFS